MVAITEKITFSTIESQKTKIEATNNEFRTFVHCIIVYLITFCYKLTLYSPHTE